MNDVTRGNTECMYECVCECVYHEESKDRPERREVPGILSRQRNERYIKAAK